MNKKIIFAFLLTALLAPAIYPVQAITIEELMGNAVDIVLLIVSAVVVILWVVTGLAFLTAQGDPGKLNTARMALIWSVVGTAVILLAQGAISMVRDALGIY